MRYLILFLILANIVVYLLPKESQRTVHSYTRGDASAQMLMRLDEQEAPPPKESLVAPGLIRVAAGDGVTPLGAGQQLPPGAAPDIAVAGSVEEPAPEVARTADNAGMEDEALASIESQGRFDKGGAGTGEEGIAAVEPPATGAIARGPLKCYTLGPFKQREEANALMASMVKKGIKPALRTAKSKEPAKYWVYLPSFPTREKAIEAVDRLQALGFDDFYIVADPRHNNAISLGLFSRKSGSRQRVRDLKEMGFEPKVETRYEEREVYWIDYASHGEIDWKPLYGKFKDADQVANEPRDCEGA